MKLIDTPRSMSFAEARPSAWVADRVPRLCFMEAFESFVALALEAEGLVVSKAIKFPVRLQTRRKDHVEIQTHGYEVDLVGARADSATRC